MKSKYRILITGDSFGDGLEMGGPDEDTVVEYSSSEDQAISNGWGAIMSLSIEPEYATFLIEKYDHETDQWTELYWWDWKDAESDAQHHAEDEDYLDASQAAIEGQEGGSSRLRLLPPL